LAVKQRIAAWAGHAGRELLVWFGFARNALQWAIGWLRAVTLRDLAILAWVALFIAIAVLVVQDFSRDVVTIEPISTPKAFAEAGYTPEVASRRLHDVLNSYAEHAGSNMPMHVAQSGELPDFIVPKLDLSLHAIVVSVRSALHYRESQRISGEFTRQGKLTLRIRVDGHEVYSGTNASDDPDALLAAAAPQVMDKIRPYLVALTMFHKDPVRAIKATEKADEIIARLGETDINAQWLYLLKGQAAFIQNKLKEAESFDRKAIELGWPNWVAHNNLGFDLQRQGRIDEAIVQFRRAIDIESSAPLAHKNLAVALRDKAGPNGKVDDAIEELRHSLKHNPHYSPAHFQLGLTLRQQGKLDEAIAAYQAAIRYAPGNDPDLAAYHYNLGLALRLKAGDGGKLDDAIAEYKQVIALDSDHSEAHSELGLIWLDQKKFDEAIREFNEAIAADPDNGAARDNLERARRMKQNSVAKN
jgi:tetratricopeptide (TPR) repeat protein